MAFVEYISTRAVLFNSSFSTNWTWSGFTFTLLLCFRVHLQGFSRVRRKKRKSNEGVSSNRWIYELTLCALTPRVNLNENKRSFLRLCRSKVCLLRGLMTSVFGLIRSGVVIRIKGRFMWRWRLMVALEPEEAITKIISSWKLNQLLKS